MLPEGPKLNLGCGPVQPASWVNIDGSNRAWLASRVAWLDRLLTRAGVIPPTEFGPHIKFHDLFKTLPYAANSVSCIYAGELWEHFEYADAVTLTRECFRVLRPGGVLRVCVPDGVAFWKKYLDTYDAMLRRPKDDRTAEPLKAHVAMYFREICTRQPFLKSMGHTHKWQYDDIQLIELFESQGFSSVARMPFQVSQIPDVALVERSNFLIVEGTKLPGKS